ncbi:gamma-tubulin complex component [Niveomyces insectorum RCEF 264]|uniref:Spindle pole body component n=1 Tax=Niveomyces insectorum RCEF 264 TaxID=1081102 RepID=A0A167MVX0_9HYPO|nr:gamma-tubulin complex component [Niveomyces insectorum RCEF 264]
MSNSDTADLFAIPDFWRLPSWQQEPQPADEKEDAFFHLEIDGDGHGPLALFLGKDGHALSKNDEDGAFFKIPAPLLGQLSPQTDTQESSSSIGKETVGTDELPAQPVVSFDVDDFWLFPDENRAAPPPPPKYMTWAAFEHADVPHSTPLFATEQGPDLVDALVAADGNPLHLAAPPTPANTAHDVLEARGYCGCLLALALGRSSVLFTWDDTKRRFRLALGGARISGYTADILRSFETACLDCGNDSRFLRAFVDHTYAGATQTNTPSQVALARGVDQLLVTLQSELGARGQKTQSLLQLQALVQPVASLVQYVRGLVTKLSRVAATTAPTVARDEQFLTMLFQEAQAMEYSAVFMRDVVKHLLQLVSEPWLGFVREWIGLDPKSKFTLWSGELQSKRFVRVGDRVWVDELGMELAELDYFLDETKMPAFVPDEMAKSLFETGRNLRFLWTNHPEHPLSNPATFALPNPPRLRWHFDWESVCALQNEAAAYEQALSRALTVGCQTSIRPIPPAGEFPLQSERESRSVSQPTSGLDFDWRLPSVGFQFFGKDENQIEQGIQASIARLNGPVPHRVDEDGLAAVLRRQLFKDGNGDAEETAAFADFTPHWSLLPLLSFGPIISTQARLVNRECMKLLFSAHGLREHLQLQRQFQLLGNGMFCSRLSHALFDPDLAGAGQQNASGVELSSGGLGLRLADRKLDNWPPASSELRLALMGVLAESYSQNAKTEHNGAQPAVKHELPGGLSFSVRDLSWEEMDKCMDPDSLEALDFLRLSYKPPSALLSVITPAVLDNYDRVFKLLLRVLRMHYVVNQLMRDDGATVPHRRGTASARSSGSAVYVAARFRIEARHFVANLMAYFLDTGVGVPWQTFDAWLDHVQAGLSEETMADRGEPRWATSPEGLRARHDQMLDEILQALLLRKRQQPLFQLLQGIFGLVLAFAKSTREYARAVSRAGRTNGSVADDDDDNSNNNNNDNDDNEYRAARRLYRDTTKKLYASFRKKVAAFLAVCRGLSEKEADSRVRKDLQQQQQQHQLQIQGSDNHALSRLLLMLDYNGFYTTSSR